MENDRTKKYYLNTSDLRIPESEISEAALQDYQKQTKFDNAYDREKGFIEGAKWAIKRIKTNVHKNGSEI